MGGRSYENGAGAFSIYLILSVLFFGRGLVGHLADRYIGIGTDPGLFIFFLEWWKYVFTHHVNPFFTDLQWTPDGANLAWSTFIPLFGFAAIPLTATLGPVATANLLVLLCPALAAWGGVSALPVSKPIILGSGGRRLCIRVFAMDALSSARSSAPANDVSGAVDGTGDAAPAE